MNSYSDGVVASLDSWSNLVLVGEFKPPWLCLTFPWLFFPFNLIILLVTYKRWNNYFRVLVESVFWGLGRWSGQMHCNIFKFIYSSKKKKKKVCTDPLSSESLPLSYILFLIKNSRLHWVLSRNFKQYSYRDVWAQQNSSNPLFLKCTMSSCRGNLFRAYREAVGTLYLNLNSILKGVWHCQLRC